MSILMKDSQLGASGGKFAGGDPSEETTPCLPSRNALATFVVPSRLEVSSLMDRQHRRELKHDRFVDELGTLSTKARDNQRFLLTVTAGIVALVLIGWGIFFYRSNREQKAKEALAAAITTNDSPLIPKTGGEAMPGAKYKTEAERNAAAEKQFKAVVDSYGGTDSADIANLYLAKMETSRGNIAAAKTRLQNFVNDHSKSVLAGAARYSLYELRIENGEAPQVTQELTAEVAKADPILPPDTILALLAHAYDAQGNEVKSKEQYRRITTEFPDSPYAQEAQRKAGPAAS